MSKLLIITLRWMRRDKKRTLLSFISIVMAMYLLTFLGVYFSSFLSMMRSEERYSEGSYHARIDIESLEQGKQIINNASVSEGAYTYSQYRMFYSRYLNSYAGKSGNGVSYLPMVSFNGTPYAQSYSASLTAGDIGSLNDTANFEISGRMPQNDSEVTVDQYIAEQYGLKAGDELTIRYEVKKTGVEYIAETVPYSDTGLDYSKAVWDNVNDKGEPVYAADSGSIVNRLIQQYTYGEGDYESALGSDSDLVTDIEALFGDGVVCHEDTDYVNNAPTKYRIYTVKAKDTGEAVEEAGKTYKVVGVFQKDYHTDLCFYAEDEWAAKFFSDEVNGSAGTAFVRIKEGLDIDTEVKQICDSVNITMSEDIGGHIVEHVMTNDGLILLEGRGYDRAGNTLALFAVMILISSVFIFFARLIVNNAFELSSAYRAEQYGTLKTIGASNRQIFAMVLAECMLYMLAALPIAIGLALLTGKIIMSKIMDLKIYDLMYGDGVTEKFFSLEIIPVVFGAAVFVSVFSVMFSGYACAIRIKKLTPAAALTGKRVKRPPKKRKWLSRKLFGFPAGYAARSAGRNKMRGFITLLAAIVSVTLVITITAIIYGIEKEGMLQNDGLYDYRAEIEQPGNGTVLTVTEVYQKFADSGYFTDIEPLSGSVSFYGDASGLSMDCIEPSLTEAYLDLLKDSKGSVRLPGFSVVPVTRTQFERFDTDLTYDDLLSKGGLLLCNNGYSVKRATRGKSLGVDIFREDLTSVEVPYWTSTAKVTYATRVLEVSGYYTTSSKGLACTEDSVISVIPVELVHEFSGLVGSVGEDGAGAEPIYLGLRVKHGMEPEATAFLKENCSHAEDNVTFYRTRERISDALKIAGMALATVVFAVALINIVSTSAANIVNRRWELSMLRACGMSMKQIIASLTIETAVCAVITAAVSSVLGRFLAGVLFGSENSNLVSLPWFAALLIGLLIFALMLGSYLLPLRTMAHSSIANEVRSKE